MAGAEGLAPSRFRGTIETMRRSASSLALLLAPSLAAALAGPACAPVHNYPGPGPRYAGGWARPGPAGGLRVVSFNIKYAREVDRAIDLLKENESLRGAQVIALQEMDAQGVRRIAEALGCEYVYYPAAFHPGGGKDFGNAVLVHGHIEEDHKLVLPHRGRFGGMQRIAVAATVRIGDARLRVYSTHLGTPKDLSAGSRRDQVRAIVEDAAFAEGPVVVAGDFNDHDVVVNAFQVAGFEWATRGIGRTIALFSWDHVFVRGLHAAGPSRRGVAENNHASDHRPVWVDLLAGSPRARPAGAGAALSTAPRTETPSTP